MTSRKRCTVCRDYFLPHEMTRVDNMTRVCSSECLSVLMGKRRSQRSKVTKKSAARSSSRLAPKIPIAIRAEVHTRDLNLCRNCGRTGTQCHHVQYRSQGGSHDLSNLILLCSHCHLQLAHGVDARRYRELFRAYIWLCTVENLSLFIPEIELRLERLELDETAA